jgi:hypothetical protein
MAPENQRYSEVHKVDHRWTEALTESDEQRMFREAIPEPTPEVTEEELARFAKEEPEHPPETEGLVITPPTGPLGTPVQADRTVSPYYYGGRLFYTKPDGNVYSSSAQFVGQSNILLTAAHSVRDYVTGNLFTGFVFYRGYNNLYYEERFDINYASTNSGWVYPPFMRNEYDYAFLRTVGSAAGALVLMAPFSDPNWTAFGYPTNYDNGEVMYTVNGTQGQVLGGVVQMLNNPMLNGSSGGAWVAQNTYVIGNQSFSYAGFTEAWGPVYNQDTLNLFATVRDAP